MKEDFLLSVIHADGKDNAMPRLQAERIGFHPDKARVACIMELTGAQDASSLSTLKQVVELLEGRPAIDLIAIHNTRQIVLYKPHLHPREPNADICEASVTFAGWRRSGLRRSALRLARRMPASTA